MFQSNRQLGDNPESDDVLVGQTTPIGDMGGGFSSERRSGRRARLRCDGERDKVYGFTETGNFVRISPSTGAATFVSASGEAWWGAAVTTRAPVVE